MATMEYQFRDLKLWRVTYKVSIPVVEWVSHDESRPTGDFTQKQKTEIIATNLAAHEDYRFQLVQQAIMLALTSRYDSPEHNLEIVHLENLGGISSWIMQ